MNSKRMGVGLAAGLMLAGGLLWSGHAYAWGGHHGGHDMMSAMPVVVMVKKGNLTDDQKHQVATILTNHKTALETDATQLRTARRTLMTQMTSDTPDPAALSAAYDGVATASKTLALEWNAVRGEVQALLTPDQTTQLKAMRDKFVAKMDARQAEHPQAGSERLDKWIDRLSK